MELSVLQILRESLYRSLSTDGEIEVAGSRKLHSLKHSFSEINAERGPKIVICSYGGV
jgi:hypothetical protein